LTSKPLYPEINPTDYLTLAKALSTSSDYASLRSAIDRAYYAAFLTCRDLLASKNYFTPKYDSEDHIKVQEGLKSLNVLGSAGNDEFRLRRTRNRITYDTRPLSPRQDGLNNVFPVQLVVTTAENIIRRVQALPVNQPQKT
jgi:hypothetical protein